MRQGVDVMCIYHKNGQIKPVSIIWDNGHEYHIDRILQITAARSGYNGKPGIRFTCLFGHSERFLFLEEGKWFIEQIVQ